MSGVSSQARMEIALTLRRGESLLVTIGIPVGILAFFSIADVLPHDGRAVDFLMPGVLALSVISSAMTSLSIATGFERQSGVLRRLGITPLGRSGLLAAKLIRCSSSSLLQVDRRRRRLRARVGARGQRTSAAVALVLGTVAFAASASCSPDACGPRRTSPRRTVCSSCSSCSAGSSFPSRGSRTASPRSPERFPPSRWHRPCARHYPRPRGSPALWSPSGCGRRSRASSPRSPSDGIEIAVETRAGGLRHRGAHRDRLRRGDDLCWPAVDRCSQGLACDEPRRRKLTTGERDHRRRRLKSCRHGESRLRHLSEFRNHRDEYRNSLLEQNVGSKPQDIEVDGYDATLLTYVGPAVGGRQEAVFVPRWEVRIVYRAAFANDDAAFFAGRSAFRDALRSITFSDVRAV